MTVADLLVHLALAKMESSTTTQNQECHHPNSSHSMEGEVGMVGRAFLVPDLVAADQEMHLDWVVPAMQAALVEPVDPVLVAAQLVLVEGSTALVESTIQPVDSTTDHQAVQLVHHLPNRLVDLPDQAGFN